MPRLSTTASEADHPALKRVTVARLSHGCLRLAPGVASGGVEKLSVEHTAPLSTIAVKVVRHAPDGSVDDAGGCMMRADAGGEDDHAWKLIDSGEAAREAEQIRGNKEKAKTARAERMVRFESALQERVQRYYTEKSQVEAAEAEEAAEAHAAALHRQQYYTSVQHKHFKRPTSAPGHGAQRQEWGRRSLQLAPKHLREEVAPLRASADETRTESSAGNILRRVPSGRPVVAKAAAKALADANRAEAALLKHRSVSPAHKGGHRPHVSVRVVKATPCLGTSATCPVEPACELTQSSRPAAKKAPLPPAARGENAARAKHANSMRASQRAKSESNRYRTDVMAKLSHQLEQLNGQLPKLCPCDNPRGPLDPYYTHYCARNCPLYRNPAQYQVALKHAVHMMGLD